MCGIFGVLCRNDSTLHAREVGDLLDRLFLLSESRGKEASGILLATEDHIRVLRGAQPASSLIRSRAYQRLLADSCREAAVDGPKQGQQVRRLAAIGHSRLVTNGTELVDANNQPVLARHSVGVHNGIIVNTEDLCRRFVDLPQETELDSALIFGLLDLRIEAGMALPAALQATFAELTGAASIAAALAGYDGILLATNTGSLYWSDIPALGVLLFASEELIVEKLLARGVLRGQAAAVRRLEPGFGALVAFAGPGAEVFALNGAPPPVSLPARAPRRLEQVEKSAEIRPSLPSLDPQKRERLERRYRVDEEIFHRLPRCTRCILPATMPFIDFDADGVCNYCRYPMLEQLCPRAELDELLARLKPAGRPLKCLVGASGGRDSSFVLHYVKKELGLDPVAYTYDWGLVTDLARRNVSRLCGKLGIEHILVSADIRRKRANVRRNVEAWLARPKLGLIPLFMAGDKQYFYHAQRLKKAMGLGLVVLGENMLERTHFKTGFAGVRPALGDREHVYTLPGLSKLRLMAYYGGAFLRNPRYLNRSLPDTAFAFGCYYLIGRSYLNLFRYVPWRETEMLEILRQEYGWESADDTVSTWRVGDGTSAFYNFAYQSIAGFTENDTFRSNQIREGQLTRERALELVLAENQPRIPTIYDYLQTIGVRADIEDVLERIASQPKLDAGRHG